jgi:hypothetical protein
VNVRFYFDPLCPWCWVTSFWLDEVAPHRDVHIEWKPISLKVRNEAKELDPGYAERVQPAMDRSFGLLRVVEALRAAGHGDLVRPVYVEFGRHFHHGERGDGLTFDVAEALERAGADPAFAEAYDDDRWDEAVRASTAEAEAAAGDDVGTPVIAWEVDGRWKGFFGPVIPSLPDTEQALRLWDGFVMVVETPGFFELKRNRDVPLDLDSLPV